MGEGRTDKGLVSGKFERAEDKKLQRNHHQCGAEGLSGSREI